MLKSNAEKLMKGRYVSMFDREICGRSASREIYLYDEMHAEILGERMAEKARREHHRANKETRCPGNNSMRHLEKMCERNWKLWMSGKCNADFREESRERTMRIDYALEVVEEHEAQIAERMRKMHEWLMYA